MGFFSDLKDDLATAVNELVPEEEEVIRNPEETEEAKGEKEEEKVESTDSFSLDKMLEKLDSIDLSNETPESATEEEEASEPVVTEPEVKPEPVAEEKPVVETKREYKAEGVRKTMETASRMISDETAIVTQGMVVTGDITSEGSMDVIGAINGNIDILGKLNITGSVTGNSKASEIFADGAKITGEVVSEGSVKIGQSSVIIGNITATSAVIAGAVKGDIDVKGPVILDTSAIVMGDIKSKSVQINNGAVIEGKCSQCYAEVNPTSFFEEIRKSNK